MKTFRELKVWQKAHELVLEIYRITEKFPDKERFGLIFSDEKVGSFCTC